MLREAGGIRSRNVRRRQATDDEPTPGGATRVKTILLTLKSAIARANHANGKMDGRESEMDSTGRQVSQRKMRAVAILRP